MKILMLAHRIPYPPRTGDKVRAYHIARHLSREHEVTLGFLMDEPEAPRALAALRQEIPSLVYATIPRTRKRLQALLTLACGGSATIKYFDSPELGAEIASMLRACRFDLVYVSSSSMAQYVPPEDSTPILMDFVDVDSDKWLQYGARLPLHKRWVYRLEGTRLRQHELSAARRANRSVVATQEEAALLHSFAPWAPITVIPNGVDLDYFNPARVPATNPTIAFTGAMDYFPNIDAVTHFCAEVFPSVRQKVPGARFLIVGKSPVPAVRRLAQAPGVTVTGTVPDVRPFMSQATVCVAPLRVARGVQNKVLEAMAMGLPVVATTKAHEGLEAKPGEHLFVEDAPHTFADTVSNLLVNPERRASVGRAARSFVETHHSWAGSMARLDQLLGEITRTPITRTIGRVS